MLRPIQLGHLPPGEVSVWSRDILYVLQQKKYLGYKQKLRHAVNDNLGLDGDELFPLPPQLPEVAVSSN